MYFNEHRGGFDYSVEQYQAAGIPTSDVLSEALSKCRGEAQIRESWNSQSIMPSSR